MIVVAGSYERLLYGFEVNLEEAKMEPVFIIPSHTGTHKCVSSCTRFLATGSNDETIKIYDMNKKKEIGSLFNQQGTINDLSFYSDSHLLSASDDGTIGLYRTSDWECLKLLKGHKGPVISVSVHSSGKFAISLGSDQTLRVWDLMKGCLAHTERLKHKKPQSVKWHESGETYVILYDNHVAAFDCNTQSLVFEKELSQKSLSFCLYKDWIIISSDSKVLSFTNIKTGQEFQRELENGVRIKKVEIYSQNNTTFLVSITSDGWVQIHSLSTELDLTPITSHNTSCRLTCLSIAESFGNKK